MKKFIWILSDLDSEVEDNLKCHSCDSNEDLDDSDADPEYLLELEDELGDDIILDGVDEIISVEEAGWRENLWAVWTSMKKRTKKGIDENNIS